MIIYSKFNKSLSDTFEVTHIPELDNLVIDMENATSGKDGMLNGHYGKKHSDEWKKEASKRVSGKNNPQYGVKRTEEQKKRQSDFMKNNNPMKSQKIKEKMSIILSGKKRKESTIKLLSEINSKKWKIISPEGKIFEIKNLSQFCKDNNLGVGNMHNVSTGKTKSHKGWKCSKLD